jgi:nucleotide-binding universal stress UspA family protein
LTAINAIAGRFGHDDPDATQEARMLFKTIVASIQVHDDLARAVLAAATSLARYDAALHVVSAWPTITPGVAGFAAEAGALAGPLTQEAIAADRGARLADEAALKALAAEFAPRAATAMLDGEPGEAVTAYARRVEADVIVTGSHQKGFWGSLIAGTASRDLVREAPCAIFLVTRPYAEKIARAGGR